MTDLNKINMTPEQQSDLPLGSIASFDDSKYVTLPGFCDVHVHFREPGFCYKEDMETGSKAAARGGYTAVCTMPNLKPVPDSVENLEEQLKLIRKDLCIGRCFALLDELKDDILFADGSVERNRCRRAERAEFVGQREHRLRQRLRIADHDSVAFVKICVFGIEKRAYHRRGCTCLHYSLPYLEPKEEGHRMA